MPELSRQLLTSRSVARAHGLFNVFSGLWPLVSLRSFEKVFGHKTDDWLVYTVGGLLLTAGWTQLSSEDSPEGRRLARRLGLGTAMTLLAVDLVYVPRRRIPGTYLIDAAMEIGWVAAWIQTHRAAGTSGATDKVFAP
jgi:hypothetical protein